MSEINAANAARSLLRQFQALTKFAEAVEDLGDLAERKQKLESEAILVQERIVKLSEERSVEQVKLASTRTEAARVKAEALRLQEQAHVDVERLRDEAEAEAASLLESARSESESVAAEAKSSRAALEAWKESAEKERAVKQAEIDKLKAELRELKERLNVEV